MTSTPGWTTAPPAAPEQTPPQLRPVVSRLCAICGVTGSDLGLTSEEREAIRLGRSAVEIPHDSVSKGLVRWHDPLPGRVITHEFRCEDHEACWARVLDVDPPWPVDDGRPRWGAVKYVTPVDATPVDAIAGDDEGAPASTISAGSESRDAGGLDWDAE